MDVVCRCATFTLTLLLMLASLSTAEECHSKYRQFKNHTACLSKSSRAESVEMTASVKASILKEHNRRRAQVSPVASNMMKLTWDDELEMLARKWAEACDVRGGLRHDNVRFIPGGMDVGQNLASGTLNFTAAIKSWWMENNFYMYGMDYKEQTTENQWGFVIGHYTQMAWAATYKLGCAAAQCGDEKVIVCNYGPAGNITPFDKPYETGSACGMCKKCTMGGLCDCGDIHCHGGRVNSKTCQCDCSVDGEVPSFMPEPHCQLKCDNTKDISYCGRPGVTDCNQSWIRKKCPHMCKVCPQ